MRKINTMLGLFCTKIIPKVLFHFGYFRVEELDVSFSPLLLHASWLMAMEYT